MKASRRLVDDGDFAVNDVSHHARMRAKERGLPLESLSGHAPGVKTVREFNVSLKIDGATARSSRILPAMNADIDGALAQSAPRIEAMDPKTIKEPKHL